MLTCADLEITLCDYVDGTLRGEQKSAVEKHLAACPACAEFARDCGAALRFIERVEDVRPPQELLTKIVFEGHAIREKEFKQGPLRRWLSKWFAPVLQPRFAMGMAMTVLSFAMMGKFAGIEVRQLKPSDLNPVAVYTAVENKVANGWGKAVKYYEGIKFVFEIQSRLDDWRKQAEEDRRNDELQQQQEQEKGRKKL
jgi:Putative zinc-finger